MSSVDFTNQKLLKIPFFEHDVEKAVFDDNEITELCVESDHLLELSIQRNKISSYISLCCTNLVSLNLASNMIEHLPASFGEELVSLKKLDLSQNILKELPRSFYSLCCLEELNLSHNQLHRFHWTIIRLLSLWEIDFSGNPLPFPDEMAVKLRAMEYRNFRVLEILRYIGHVFFDEHVKDAAYTFLMIHSFRREECETVGILPRNVILKICGLLLETKEEKVWWLLKDIWFWETPEFYEINNKIRLGIIQGIML